MGNWDPTLDLTIVTQELHEDFQLIDVFSS